MAPGCSNFVKKRPRYRAKAAAVAPAGLSGPGPRRSPDPALNRTGPGYACLIFYVAPCSLQLQLFGCVRSVRNSSFSSGAAGDLQRRDSVERRGPAGARRRLQPPRAQISTCHYTALEPAHSPAAHESRRLGELSARPRGNHRKSQVWILDHSFGPKQIGTFPMFTTVDFCGKKRLQKGEFSGALGAEP